MAPGCLVSVGFTQGGEGVGLPPPSPLTGSPAWPGPGPSVASCAINLSNTILGAGILGLPYAFAECGVALGLALFALSGLLSATGLHLLSACARAVPDGSFNVMADLTVPYLALAPGVPGGPHPSRGR